MREAERKRLIELLEGKSIDTRIDVEYVADYLLESGVIVPPCKVGDVVYVLGDEYFWEAEIIGYSVMTSKWNRRGYEVVQFFYKGEEKVNSMFVEKIGKEMFFSKAEAEYALKNRRSVSLIDGHIEE